MSTEINNVNHNLNVIIMLTLICVNTHVCGVTVNEAKKSTKTQMVWSSHFWKHSKRITIITFISSNI